jgi:hypothetical protein
MVQEVDILRRRELLHASGLFLFVMEGNTRKEINKCFLTRHLRRETK